jgi:hypothetical protein
MYIKTITYLLANLFASISTVVAEAVNTRTVINLSPRHRLLMLTEMWQFLSGFAH